MLLFACNLYLSEVLLRWKMQLNCFEKRKEIDVHIMKDVHDIKNMEEKRDVQIASLDFIPYWAVVRRCCWKQQFHVCSLLCTGTRPRSAPPSLC